MIVLDLQFDDYFIQSLHLNLKMDDNIRHVNVSRLISNVIIVGYNHTKQYTLPEIKKVCGSFLTGKLFNIR